MSRISAFAAPAALSSHDERLANGCQLQLLHRPRAGLTALWLRVAAGSHDEPPQWPGLAHFLEHMLFLGGARFCGEQRLMPFVQACGGRLNASTGARTTDFFFEVPDQCLEAAAERLLDMLVNPLFDPAAQLAERQVLQAEYQARAADAGQRGGAALQQALAAGHPCTGFHAGNAESLRADLPEFRAALAEFHQRHYRAGNCRLLLMGSQPTERLLALGRRLAACLPGDAAPLAGPVLPMLPLQARHWRLQGRAGRVRLGLVCQSADLPPGTLELLGDALASPQTGGWLGLLRERGLAAEVQVQTLYQHAGQALLALRCEGVGGDVARLRAGLLGWLRAFASAAPWDELQVRHAEERRWREAALRPLELARAWLERPTAGAWAALPGLLAELGESCLISLEETDDTTLPLRDACGFRLPLAEAERATLAPPELPAARPDNPLLRAAPPDAAAAPPPLVEREGQQACLFLRGLPRYDLNAVTWAAERLGMELSQGPEGLRLQGWAAHLPALLTAVRGAAPAGAESHAGEMPIRRLLRQLPEQLPLPVAGEQALLVGPVELAGHLPGLGEARASLGAPPELGAGRHWRHLPGSGGDAALLLFCPVPPAQQAAARWLGPWLAPAFHRRLRDELQLGYALFAGFRQVQGRAGLLFAVQSPRAGVEALLAEVEAFLAEQVRRLVGLDQPPLDESRTALARALRPESRPLAELAEDCWQACLAGLPAEHPRTLAEAVERLDRAALRDCLNQLVEARHGWLLLATD
jgi:coenzyme PQQ biosynthesis probable peptidase PqqF